jgi:hypothetical protein
MQYRNRYYSTALGRFVSRDPLAANNLYWGMDDKPTRGVDPEGKSCWVKFQCDLIGSKKNCCNRDCAYKCVEIERKERAAPGWTCEEVPENLVRFESNRHTSYLCRITKGLIGTPKNCKKQYFSARWFVGGGLPGPDRDCSRKKCWGGCDKKLKQANKACGRLGTVGKVACKAAAMAAHNMCMEVCTAWCRKP